MKETRSGVLLTRLAKKLRKDTGNHHYRARVEDERASLRTLIYISCTRPICKGSMYAVLERSNRLCAAMQTYSSRNQLLRPSA